jgi:hypothetical protein
MKLPFSPQKRRRTFFFSAVLVLLGWHVFQQPVPHERSFPQLPPVVKYYDQAYYRQRIDSLKAAFGFKKLYPPEYELQTLLALSHYPELRNAPIHFQKVEQAFPLIAARPDPLNLLRNRSNWIYNVYISEKATEPLEPDLFANFSFNAQVGILGHELAHTLYYQDKTAADMIAIGVKYLFSDPYKAKFEQDTDRQAIAHGMGWQVLEYSTHYRQNSRLSPQEISAIDRYYLNPSLVKAVMHRYGFYREVSAERKTASLPLPAASDIPTSNPAKF